MFYYRSKQFCPKISGSYPRHPGRRPLADSPKFKTWKQKADRFAAFALTYLMPWDLETQAPNVPLNYEELLKWATSLKSSKDDINRGRLYQLMNLSSPFSIPRESMELVNAGRYRGCKPWGEQESHEQDYFEQDRDTDSNDVREYIRNEESKLQDDMATLLVTGFESSSHNREATMLASSICDMLNKANEQASGTVSELLPSSGRLLPDDRQRNLKEQMRDQTDASVASNIISKIKATKNDDDANDDDDDEEEEEENVDDEDVCVWSPDLDGYEIDENDPRYSIEPASTLAPIAVEEQCVYPEYKEPEGLNDGQRKFFQSIFKYFIDLLRHHNEGGPMPMAPLVMLDGAAGTGKTWVLAQLIKLLGEEHFITVAATGSAAFQMEGNSSTAHSFFNIKVMAKSTKKSLQPQLDIRPLKTVENLKVIRCKFLIIDEISLVPPPLFLVCVTLL